jgi:putative protease
MKKPELLAPAGNYESLVAAIQAGCDAVYLGGTHFGARAFSNNFTDEEIVKAINYAHLYGVKIYVTCNTLIYDDEVESFISFIEFLYKNNVDAVLIQDLGMFDLVHQTFPNLEIHASTQMHIHNLDGVEYAKKMGVKRVVLARETSYEQIEDIKKNTTVPIEVFIHGALCVSYSGQCLMSYLNGGRSGNRGECAGSCRMEYQVIDGNKVLNKDDRYPLSTKDLNSLENIGKLIDIGIDSLKIEGRMKSPSYVYLVVKLYRLAIDSYINTGKVYIDKNMLHDLKITFNRDYTKGFLFNEDNNAFINMKHPNHQGIKIGEVIDYKKHFVTIKLSDNLYIGDGLRIIGSNELGVKVNEFFKNYQLIKEANNGDVISLEIHGEATKGDIVLKTSSEHITNYVNKDILDNTRKVEISALVKAKIGQPLTIRFDDGKNIIEKNSVVLEKAQNLATSKDTIIEKINKLGDTVYNINNLEIDMDDNVFVPLKMLNDLRREVIDELNIQRIGYVTYVKKDYEREVSEFPRNFEVNALVGNQSIYNKLDKSKFNNIYADEDIEGTIKRYPRVMNNYLSNNIRTLVSELGALNKNSNVETDTSFNVVNSYSVAFLHAMGVKKITLSHELKYDQVRKLLRTYEDRYGKHPNLEVVVYGRIEAMTTKFSLNKYYGLDNLIIKSRFGDEYPIITKDNFMTVYSSKVFDLPDDYHAIGVNAIRYDYFLEKDFK